MEVQSVPVEERVELQQATWKGFTENTWFGTGAGSFRFYFHFTAGSSTSSFWGRVKSITNTHTATISVLMEYGILGVIQAVSCLTSFLIIRPFMPCFSSMVHLGTLAGEVAARLLCMLGGFSSNVLLYFFS